MKKLILNTSLLLCGTLTASQLQLADVDNSRAAISYAEQNSTVTTINSSAAYLQKNGKTEVAYESKTIITQKEHYEGPLLTELRKTVQYDKDAKCYLTNDARVVLKTAIAQTPAGESLPDDAWEGIYFRLWTYANIFGVESTYKDFPDVIDIMKEAGKLYDPKLQLPCTEYGFFKDHQAKVVYPLLPTQTVIIFGGHRNRKLHAEYGENIAYTVNIDDGTFYGGFWGKLEPDMFADMNNSVHLQLLPSESFDKVIIESVPVIDYFSPVFFQNANRLLKIGGILEANT